MAPKTRENVRRIARELNSVLNSAARALLTGRSDIITVVSGILSEPYYANIVHHLEDYISNEIKSIIGAANPKMLRERD